MVDDKNGLNERPDSVRFAVRESGCGEETVRAWIHEGVECVSSSRGSDGSRRGAVPFYASYKRVWPTARRGEHGGFLRLIAGHMHACFRDIWLVVEVRCSA